MSETSKYVYSSMTSVSSYQSNSIEFFDHLKNNNKPAIVKMIRNPNFKVWTYTEEGNNSGLHVAALKDYSSLIKSMLQEIEENYVNESISIISDWINKPNDKGDTAIHYLSYRGNVEVIKFIDKYKCEAGHKNKQGNTVLHYAAQGNQPNTFIYLKHKYGLPAEEVNKEGSTPLHWACYTGSDLAFCYIMRYVSDLNKQDNDGFTSLHLAVMSERTGMIKALLHGGADRYIADKKGRTPKSLAEEKGKDLISEMLKDNLTCSLIVIRNPLKKIEKSSTNVWIFILLHLITYFVIYGYILPGNYISNFKGFDSKLLLGFSSSLFFLIIPLYFYLLITNPGVEKDVNEDALYVKADI